MPEHFKLIYGQLVIDFNVCLKCHRIQGMEKGLTEEEIQKRLDRT